MPLTDKRILLGVSAGIAAYKSAELLRLLRAAGARTRVMMTPAAHNFITPLTLQALSGHPVHSALLDAAEESAFGHIELARWADVVLLAPASADVLARLAHGLADDMVSAVCLASAAPLLAAPAMNQQMWAAPATQDNLAVLRRRGVEILGPASGELACGEFGLGRMLEAAEILEHLTARLNPGVLRGRRVLITAGPTREDLDPVRFISNRSSGRMGYALAQAAHEAGAAVTLVSGPVCLACPAGVECVKVYSAADMLDAVLEQAARQDIFISAAAVADYRPARQAAHKMKKDAAELTLSLERTEDILARTADFADSLFRVGFAAETQDLERYAQDKLARKKLAMIAANDVSVPGLGFDSEENALHVFWPGGSEKLPRASKLSLARRLITLIAERYAA